MVNHNDMTNNQFHEIESILSDLFNETKSTMNEISDTDIQTIYNNIIQEYSSTNDINGNLSPLVQAFTSDNIHLNDNDIMIFTYNFGGSSPKILRYFNNTISTASMSAFDDPYWGGDTNFQIESTDKAYYYVFEATLKSSANVSIVGTITI